MASATVLNLWHICHQRTHGPLNHQDVDRVAAVWLQALRGEIISPEEEGDSLCLLALQVPSLSAHAGAAAVRALQEGAGQCSVRQVH